jgi:hypothetical protein
MPGKRDENAIVHASAPILPVGAVIERRALASEGKDGARKKGVEGTGGKIETRATNIKGV